MIVMNVVAYLAASSMFGLLTVYGFGVVLNIMNEVKDITSPFTHEELSAWGTFMSILTLASAGVTVYGVVQVFELIF